MTWIATRKARAVAEYRTFVDIEAAPHIVFELLTTEAGMTAWMGQWAQLDPVPGGDFAVDIAGHPARGTYLEVDPPRRLSISWGFAGHDTLPPGASTVTFELTPTATGTRLDLVHTGLPDSDLPGHARGWTHFTDRLRRAGRGEHLPVDTWSPQGDPAAPEAHLDTHT